MTKIVRSGNPKRGVLRVIYKDVKLYSRLGSLLERIRIWNINTFWILCGYPRDIFSQNSKTRGEDGGEKNKGYCFDVLRN